MTPTRLTVVLTHPVQYYAAWFRWIHANAHGIDLHVVYAAQPTAQQQGVGFDRSFTWDVPLTDGYRSTVVRDARPSDRFDAGHFRGLDVRGIGEAIRRTNPDVVAVFGWYSITLTRAIRAARRLKVPVLYHGDTNLQSGPGGWRRLPWLMKTRWRLSQYDAALSVGVRGAAFLRYFGVRDDRIFHTPHCVDNDRFAEAASWRRCATRRREIREALGLPIDAFVVLFAGKLEPKKHPMDLVRALSAMTPPPHLAIAGTGPLEAAVADAAAQSGIGVSRLGFINQSEMPRVYAAADCLALPSDARETWGLVVNEALAAGLPCVVSDQVGCAPDLAGDATGGVYATAEPTELVRNFSAALTSVRDRLRAGHDFTAPCQDRAASYAFAEAAAGLERACTVVTATPAPQPAPAPGADLRVVACCGGMVLVGGLERMTFEILGVLRDRRAPVHCIVNGWDHSRIVAMAERIGASWSTGFYWHLFTRRVRSPLIALRMGWDMVRTSGGLLRDAWGFRASHVFVSDHITTLRNVAALWILRMTGTRVILRLGNAPDPGRFYRWVWRFGVSPAVDLFVCNSPYTERALAAHGIAPSKRLTIPHTPPTRLPSTAGAIGPRDAGLVMYMGQIIPEKGVDLLLDAVALLAARGRDVRVDIAGPIDGWGPPDHQRYREGLVARAAAPDLAGRVRFLGHREDVPALLATAAIHCCPSRQEQREGFGIVVIEAKQAGIPSVVTTSGALPDLVTHGEDGWICREETAEAIAEGIDYFLDPGRLRHGMAAAQASAGVYSRDRFERAWRVVFHA